MSTKELYLFIEGTTTYAYTSSNEAETYNGNTYVPQVMGRGEESDSSNTLKTTIDVKMPLRAWMAQHILASGVDSIIRLELYTKDEDGTVSIIFRGRLTSPSTDNEELTAQFENVFSANRQVGARPLFQRTCRHTLYGPRCKMSLDTFKIACTVTAISADGTVLTVTGLDSRSYNSGVLVMPDGTYRYIVTQVGSTVTLIRASDVLNEAFQSGPVNTYIAPGCTQTMPTCQGLFGNLNRFGGFPWIPNKNPMAGSSIVAGS